MVSLVLHLKNWFQYSTKLFHFYLPAQSTLTVQKNMRAEPDASINYKNNIVSRTILKLKKK